jgi:tRNA pseudouridine55 synthase
VTIFELDLLEQTADTITLHIKCSKGTYIRTLAQDIGEALGCGAHLSMLRRTNVEPFDCTKLLTIEEIEKFVADKDHSLKVLLLPIDSALPHHPPLVLSDDEVERMKYGLKVSRRDIPDSQIIRLYSEENIFIGIGRLSSDEQLAPRRLMRTN